jgi:hypothetical protein
LEEADRWLQRIRMMVLEQHERPVWRDARQVVEVLQAAHADAIRWPTIVWAITFFDSQYLPKHSGAAGRDFVRELLDAARGTDIKVIPYCHVGVMHRETFAVHPEWAARDWNGEALRWKGLHYLHCLSNPESMAAYRGAVGEVVRNYDVPALYFDGPVWYGLCFCLHCRASFQRRWGYPLPEKLAWEDNSRHHYNEMRYANCVEAMRQLKSAIREAQAGDPRGGRSGRRVPAMFNTGMTHSSGRRNGSIPERVMAHAEGCLSTEVHRRAADDSGEHGSYLGIVETVKLGASLQRISLCYTPPGPFDSLVTHESLDTELFGATYLALGGTPIIETARSFLFDRTGIPAVRALYERMERHAPLYYDAQPVRHALLLYSRQSAEHCTGDDLNGRYAQHFAGAARALSHGHQAYECLYDRHLCAEALAGARVLFLANAMSLSDVQLDVIRAFVRDGGGVVATAETSLYDETGRRRRDFGLADLFGVSYRRTCPPGDYDNLQYREGDGYQPVPEAYLRWLDAAAAGNPAGATRDPQSQRDGSGMPANASGAAVAPALALAAGLRREQAIPISDAWWVGGRKAAPDYVITALAESAGGDTDAAAPPTAVAELFLPAGGAYGEPFSFPFGHPPGVVASTYGKGRVVYIASGVTRHYLRRGLRSLRILLSNAVDWAASAPRPFRVDGPATLLAHLTRYPGSYPAGDVRATETLALHLINYTGEMYEDAAHRVEYVAPLRDLPIEVAVPDRRTVLAVERLVTGDAIAFTVEAAEAGHRVARLRLPELGPTESILVRLGPD